MSQQAQTDLVATAAALPRGASPQACDPESQLKRLKYTPPIILVDGIEYFLEDAFAVMKGEMTKKQAMSAAANQLGSLVKAFNSEPSPAPTQPKQED